MSKNRNNVSVRLLLEIFSIVFSVLLALSLNEWRQNYNRKHQVARILNIVKDEIKNNSENLKQVVNNQTIYRDSLVSKLKHNGEALFKGKSFSKVLFALQNEIGEKLQINTSLSAAWATAKALGIVGEIDATLALRFAEMEQLNGLAQEQSNNLSQFVLGLMAFDEQNSKHITMAFINSLDNLINIEQQLLDIYAQLESSLNEKN